MKLKTIQFENLKGHSGTYTLDGANIIHGRNFTGKTAVIDAIKLALIGYHPSLDRTAQGVFDLASGEELRVTAMFTNGTDVIQRQWRRRDGRITKASHEPLHWPPVPVAMLDANEYFGKSDRGKADLLFAAATADEDKQFVDRTSRMIEMEAGAVLTQRIVFAVGEEFRLHRRPRFDNKEWLNAALDVTERLRSESAATVRKYAGTLQGIAGLQDKDEPQPLDESLPDQLLAARNAVNGAQKAVDAATADKTKDVVEIDADIEIDERSQGDREIMIAELTKRYDAEKMRFEIVMGGECCPTCGAKKAGWQSGVAVMRDERLDALKAECDAVADAVKNIVKHREKLIVKRKRRTAHHARILDDVQLRLAETQQTVAELESQQQRWMNYQADRKRLVESRDEHEAALRDEKRLKAVKGKLLGIRETMAGATFAPILEVARRFTGGIMPDLAFQNNELGYWRIDNAIKHWVPWRTFSGTEQLIAFSALQAALGATSEIKLVVMDELGRVDRENKTRLLFNVCAALVDGVIEQFVGVDTEAESGLLKEFNLIEMT